MSDLRRSGKKDELISRNVSHKLTILLTFYLDVLTASICLALKLVTLPSGRAADKQQRTFGNQNYMLVIYTAILKVNFMVDFEVVNSYTARII